MMSHSYPSSGEPKRTKNFWKPVNSGCGFVSGKMRKKIVQQMQQFCRNALTSHLLVEMLYGAPPGLYAYATTAGTAL